MATIPVYDEATLPYIVYPLNAVHELPRRFLGRRAVTGEVYADVSVVSNNDTYAKALHDFWITDCNYGLDPFLIPLPIFGRDSDTSHPALLVKMVSDIDYNRQNVTAISKFRVKVLGEVSYVVDDLGDFIISDTGDFVISDTGDYVATGNETTFKVVSYGG